MAKERKSAYRSQFDGHRRLAAAGLPGVGAAAGERGSRRGILPIGQSTGGQLAGG